MAVKTLWVIGAAPCAAAASACLAWLRARRHRAPQPLESISRRLLILAPHPDDCVLIGGGQAQQTLAAGGAVKIVHFTNGASKDDAEAASRRAQEARAAWEMAGQVAIECFDYADLEGLTNPAEIQAAVERLALLLNDYAPDRVVVPAYEGGHYQHDVVHLIANEARARTQSAAEFWEATVYHLRVSWSLTPERLLGFARRALKMPVAPAPEPAFPGPVWAPVLTQSQLELKRRMLRAFVSQSPEALVAAAGVAERLQAMRTPNYGAPPFRYERSLAGWLDRCRTLPGVGKRLAIRTRTIHPDPTVRMTRFSQTFLDQLRAGRPVKSPATQRPSEATHPSPGTTASVTPPARRRGGGVEPLRLWLLAETYYPQLGGGENHARLLAASLVELGVEVTVVTRRLGREHPATEVLDGVTIRRVLPRGSGSFAKYAAALPVWRLLGGDDRYDVVLVCGFRAFGLPAVNAARRHEKPCILRAEVAGELDGSYFQKSALGAQAHARAGVRSVLRWRRHALMSADCFVAISDAVEAEFRQAGVPPERIARIPNGLDSRTFLPATADEKLALRKALHLPQSKLLVTYTGKLNRFKGLESLLEAWAELGTHEPAELLLVGTGFRQSLSIEEELRRRVLAHPNLDSVRFVGRQERVQDWLRASDVFVFPSEAETFGVSLLEAMACGLPIVATALPALQELVQDGCEGALVPAADPVALSGALGAILADPLRRQAQSLAAAETAQRYDIGRIATRYVELFDSLQGREGSIELVNQHLEAS